MLRTETVMNDMMIGHQRNVLAALGIDIWVPKDTPHQEKSLPSIWRDQTADIVSPSVELAPVQIKKPESAPQIIIREVPQPPVVIEAAAEPVPSVPVETRVSEQVEAFALQAFSLPHCVVITETTALTEQQQRLWFNMQTAIPSQLHTLKWPFPLLSFQDGRGVSSYVQGFVDVLGMDKTLICLGNLPYIQQAKMMRLASLQEMLDKPLLKKQLWQLMQNNDEKMED